MSKTPKIKSARQFIDYFKKLDSFRQLVFKAGDRIIKDDILALIISYSIVEMILDFLVKVLCKHGDKFLDSRPPFTTKAILLNEVGVIDDELLHNLIAIKKLRHSVVHEIVDNIKWQREFTFDKNDLSYNKYVEINLGEPKDLVEHLLCIWSKLYNVGREALIKSTLRNVDEQKQ